MQTNIKGGRASLLYKTIGMEKGDFYGAAVLVKAKLLLAPRALPVLDLGQKLAQGPPFDSSMQSTSLFLCYFS